MDKSEPPGETAIVEPAPGEEADMALYAAIVGRRPEIDPTAGDPLALPPPPARPQHPWSPIVLSIYLRDVYRNGASKLTRPEITAWIRRQSAVAKKRFLESQSRLASTKRDWAA